VIFALGESAASRNAISRAGSAGPRDQGGDRGPMDGPMDRPMDSGFAGKGRGMAAAGTGGRWTGADGPGADGSWTGGSWAHIVGKFLLAAGQSFHLFVYSRHPVFYPPESEGQAIPATERKNKCGAQLFKEPDQSHFLFNTLNSIYALAVKGDERLPMRSSTWPD